MLSSLFLSGLLGYAVWHSYQVIKIGAPFLVLPILVNGVTISGISTFIFMIFNSV